MVVHHHDHNHDFSDIWRNEHVRRLLFLQKSLPFCNQGMKAFIWSVTPWKQAQIEYCTSLLLDRLHFFMRQKSYV